MPAMSAVASLIQAGYAFLSPAEVTSELRVELGQLDALKEYWSALPRDEYLRDGGRYRSRRHSCFIYDAGALTLVTHRAHWQPTSYNALHGGLERWFEPVAPEVRGNPVWTQLVESIGAIFT